MWWTLSLLTAQAACEQPTATEALHARLEALEAVWVRWAMSTSAEDEQRASAEVRVARVALEEALACALVLSPRDAARVHVMFGLMAGDDPLQMATWLRAARRVDPAASCPPAALAAGLLICEELPPPTPAEPTPACGPDQAVRGELWVDGTPGPLLPAGEATIVQRVTDTRVDTAWLTPEQGLPSGWCGELVETEPPPSARRRPSPAGPALLALGSALVVTGVTALASAHDIYNPQNCAGAEGRADCAEALSVVWSDGYAADLMAVRDRGRDLRYGLGSASAAAGVGLLAGGAAWTGRASPTREARQPGSGP